MFQRVYAFMCDSVLKGNLKLQLFFLSFFVYKVGTARGLKNTLLKRDFRSYIQRAKMDQENDKRSSSDTDAVISETKDASEIETNKDSSQVLTEGKASIFLATTKNVFYNPVQEFNRDLSIAVLTVFAKEFKEYAHDRKSRRKQNEDQKNAEADLSEKSENDTQNLDCELKAGVKYEKGLFILEALSASGLRSIRYAKEVPGVKQIVANDISKTAVASIRENVKRNEVEHLVTASHDDAITVMHKHSRMAERFSAVDLDPYGCPSMYLDGAVQCVTEGGLLLVTCTDMAVLAGNAPETCYAKYGAVSLRSKCCHEMALRIVLQCVESYANRYGRYIVPLLSISADFYVRVFVQVFTSQAVCKQSASKMAMVYQCAGCETFTLHPLMVSQRNGEKPLQFKFSIPHGPPVGINCEHCGHKYHIGGPIWIGPLHDETFVSHLEGVIHIGEFGTIKRMKGMLAVVREELNDVPMYYMLDRLCSILHVECIPMLLFRSALMNAGYRVSYSHANRRSIKTDAPATVIWDIMRHWEKQHPIRQDRRVGVAKAILSKEPTSTIELELRPDANPLSRQHGLVRFQENPQPFWGPGARAKTNIQEGKMDKSRRKQGKRKHSASSTKDGNNKAVKLEDSIEEMDVNNENCK